MKRLCVITGATGGIGSALLPFIRNDSEICCLSRKEIKDVAKCIGVDFSKDDASYVQELCCWLNSYADIDEIVLFLLASSITPIDAIGSLQNDIQSNIFINVISPAKIYDAVAGIAKQKRANLRVIHFDSGAAYRPLNGWGLYCASKSYISMFLRVLAEENPEFKIVLVDPGVVDTGMQKDIRESTSEAFTDRNQFISFEREKLLGKPQVVARAIYERYYKNWKARSICEKYSEFK